MVTDADVLELVDRDRLAARIAAVAPVGDDFDVDVLSGGRSNLTYLVRSGPFHYVVRRRPLGNVAAGAHDMAREHRVLAALQDSGLPVPLVYGYWEDDAVVGAPFYVMSHVLGSVFHRRADVERLDAGEAQAISEAAIDVLDQLHRVDVTAVGLGDLGRPEGFVARRIGRWLAQWERSPHRDHKMVEPLAQRLADAVPAHTDSTLVHGDYRLGNMLVAVRPEPHVSAVLDWEMSTLGDPLTDLAHLLVYWESTRGRRTHESQTIAEQPGFLSGAQLAARYAERSDRDLSRLDFYLAFEHWRAAIIKEAIYMRANRGDDPAADRDDRDDHDDLGESVSRHLDEAADILEKE
jgi:aminoglycoside phosphotransferase (APT) family kinase protein